MEKNYELALRVFSQIVESDFNRDHELFRQLV